MENQTITIPSETPLKVRALLTELLFSQIKHTLLLDTFAATLALFVLWPFYPQQAFAWLACLFFASIVPRIILTSAYHYFNPSFELVYKWGYAYIAIAFITGCLWGTMGLIFLPKTQLFQQMYLLFILIGVCAVANHFYLYLKGAYAAFLLPTLLPGSLILLWANEGLYFFISIALITFCLFMLVSAFFSQRLIADELLLRTENKELIENLSETKQNLESIATHDSLTQLFNRKAFNEQLIFALKKARRYKKMVGLMFLDLDQFKNVNDTLGHDAGDDLLREVALRIRKSVRDIDIIARLGGDEFTIIFEEITDPQALSIIAERILEQLRGKIKLKEGEATISTSIGISIYPIDGTDESALIKNADIAMYHAKNNGRDAYQFFNIAMEQNIQKRHSIEKSLRQAVDNQEFFLVYQPQLDINTHSLIGVEALVRWQNPELGVIPPLQFIPIAEETGLIVPLGEFVLRTACAQAHQWEKSGSPINIAVNLSGRQFNEPNIIERITDIIKETQLSPHLLEIELTETMLVKDMQRSIDIMGKLKKLGVRLAIDDFGTGYSSLNYLRHFPIDTLKIDKSFIDDSHNANGAAIVVSIIHLAHNLKFSVVAEGVETQKQLDFLKKNQCNSAQGFLLSKPLTKEAFRKFLDKHTTNASPL